MPFAFRASLLALALSLSLSGPVCSPVQSASTLDSTQSPAEAEARALVDRYFALYAAKDPDGLLSLWSEKSPDYAALKQNWRRQFAAEDFRFSQPALSRVKVEGEQASLRATVKLTATDLKSKQQRERQIARNFSLVREAGAWKIWRYAPAENDLAEALAQLKTDAERARVLAEEKELMTSELTRALVGQGDRLRNQGDYPQALTTYRLAQSISEQIGDQSGIATTWYTIGLVHRSQGDYAQALERFQKSLVLFEALGDQAAIARTLNGIGSVYWSQSNYAQALESFEKSLAMLESLGDRTGIAYLLGNIGLIHYSQGDYAQALERQQKTLAIFEALGDKQRIPGALNNIAIVYDSQGNYARALEYYQKSLALQEAAGDKAGIAGVLNNIGTIHYEQDNYAQSLQRFQQSLALREAIGDKAGIASSLHDIGRVYRTQGNYAQALEHYQKSLAMRKAIGNKAGIASTLNNIGLTYRLQGDYAQALEHHQQSLALREAIGDKAGIANTLHNIGEVYDKQGAYAKAMETASRAATLARQIGATDTLWKARFTAGAAHRALKDYAQARLAFEEAVSIIETLRANVAGGGGERQRFFESKVSPYHALVDLLTREGRLAEALSLAERAKARALLDVLQMGRVHVAKAMTEQEKEQERKLNSQLVSLNTQISQETARPQPDQARLTQLKNQLQKVRLDFEAFQTNLYAAHPELRAQRGEARPLKLEEAAALLPDAASALLEYVVAEDQTYLFALTKTVGKAEPEVKEYTLPVKRDELAKRIEAFRRQLAGRDLGFRASARQLYQMLLQPAQRQLRGKTNLVIAPDDKLWELPFQALLAGGDRYLIEIGAVSYAPSLTVLREMKRRHDQPQSGATPSALLALGNPAIGKETIERATLTLRDGKLDPLPEAEAEVKALGRLYGAARSKVYVGAEAREDRAKTEAAQARVLHFATHGILNDASPMYSHLVLAQGDKNEVKEDGLLEAWELMQLDLKADLAALSACETARGRFGAGEGMIGLTWALFVAGVPSTVVSQWKVESAATRELMLGFHRQLRSPAKASRPTKAEALRQAALKLLKRPETRHPFYWAGFVLVGDGR
jgi:CHAT domain-containing protein/tetratricopeptide (TPR) repeat protein